MSKDLAKSTLDHLNFFDNMMSRTSFAKRRTLEEPNINAKYLFKRDGCAPGVNKQDPNADPKALAAAKKAKKAAKEAHARGAKRALQADDVDADASEPEAEEEEESDDDSSEAVSAQPKRQSEAELKFQANQSRLVPINYATLDELKQRIRDKVEASRVTREAGEGKRALIKAKRAEKAAREKAKAKKKAGENAGTVQQQQKARQGDDKNGKADADAASNGANVAHKSKRPRPTLAPDAAALKTDASKIGLELQFGAVAVPQKVKDLEKALSTTDSGAPVRGSGSAGAALAKIREEKAALARLRESGKVAEAEALEQKSKMEKLLMLAQGGKVVDSEKRLRKEKKDGKSKKEESEKKWKAQKKGEETQRNKAAATRESNVKARLEKRMQQKQGTYKKPKKPVKKDGKGGKGKGSKNRMSSSEPQSSSLAAPSGADAGSDRISYDGYAPQSYMDRHVVRHLRHMRDKEYIRIAWRNCKEYSAVYQACTEKHPYLAPFKCRDSLNEMKVCINRQMVRQREQAVEIDRVPTVDPSQLIDIDTASKQLGSDVTKGQ